MYNEAGDPDTYGKWKTSKCVEKEGPGKAFVCKKYTLKKYVYFSDLVD